MTAFFNTAVYKLSYRYNLLAEKRFDFGLGVGVHYMGLAAGIGASGINASQEIRTPVPLPLIGMGGRFSFTSKFHVIASSEALYVKIKGLKGFIFSRDLEGFVIDSRVANTTC